MRESKRNKSPAGPAAKYSRPAAPKRSSQPSKFPSACAPCSKATAASEHTSNPHGRIARPALADIRWREEFRAAQSIREFETPARKTPSNKSAPAPAGKSSAEAIGLARLAPNQTAIAKPKQVPIHSSEVIIAASLWRVDFSPRHP